MTDLVVTFYDEIGRILDLCGWEMNQDASGGDSPPYRRKDWQTSMREITYAYRISDVVKQELRDVQEPT